MVGCIPENVELPCKLISVQTYDGATNISVSGATLKGKVNVAGITDTVACGVLYDTSWPSLTYASETQVQKTVYSSGEFAINISELKENTTYYYCAFAVDAGQYQLGEAYSFETPSLSATTGNVTDVKYNEAMLNGIVNSGKSIKCGFIYGTKSSLSLANDSNIYTYSSDTFSIKIDGLDAGVTYYYRAYVICDEEYRYGDIRSFKTYVVPCFDENHIHAVDLGLSVKWASCNVGAESPEDYGGYYAWGEVVEKGNYSWSTYKWYNRSYNTLTKYCTDSYYGTVDNKTVLEPEDDVAHVQWGGNWRMPTEAELDELRTVCTWSRGTCNGVAGCFVTGPNGNRIFLPAAGYCNGTGVSSRGSSGNYWSATLNDDDSDVACYLYLYLHSYYNFDYNLDYDDRYYGRTVRPVTE